MKKRVVTLMISAITAASLLTACGGNAAAPAQPAAPAAEPAAAEAKAEPEAAPEAAAEEQTEAAAEETEEVVEEAPEAEVEEEPAAEDFSLLDVDESMIESGVYGLDPSGVELVFSMFTAPSGQEFVSLFAFDNESGSGDVICGPYDATTGVDENGYNWTYFTVNDVYTGGTFDLGFGEDPETGAVVFFNAAGDVVEGEYLSESETISYMGTAAALISQ